MSPFTQPSPSSPLAVIIMGVSGCGKSTVGALIAQAYDCPFLEGDSFHSTEAVKKMRGGVPLTDADRWPWLDRLAQASATAIQTHGVVVAACSALRLAYRERLRQKIGMPLCFILLDDSREHLLQRLQSRPDHYMPASLLDSQLATLERPESEEGAITLRTDATPGILCQRALDWLNRRKA